MRGDGGDSGKGGCGQKNWESLKLSGHLRSPRHLPAAPAALSAGDTDTPAKRIAAAHEIVGVAAGASRRIATPAGVEDVVMRGDMLLHIADGWDKARVRYVNRLVPTIEDPDEVWRAEYKGEFRRHFLKAWDDKKATFIVVTEDGAGYLFYTFMPMSKAKEVNKRRRGALLYRRLEERK